MKAFFSKHMHNQKSVFRIAAAAAAVFIIVGIFFLAKSRTKGRNIQGSRPMLQMGGTYYVDPFMPVSCLPEGYALAGTLSAAQAHNTGLEGTQYFTNPDAPEDFYTYQLCGTPVDLNTVDSERLTWQYLRWIRLDAEEETVRTMTLDDVRRLAEKGDALCRDDLALYDCKDVGSGIYVFSYPIDDRFYLLAGAYTDDSEPIYYYLHNKETDEWIDIRTDDVDAFLQSQGRSLNTLRSQNPELFDLPTDEGLTVSVWQMAENSYRCDLHAGPVQDEQAIWNAHGVSIEEMRAILSTYAIGPEDIAVELIHMPYSSYACEIDEACARTVRELLLGAD